MNNNKHFCIEFLSLCIEYSCSHIDVYILDFQMMQKLGKFDSTKDDVFGDFVNNFTKQHVSMSTSCPGVFFYYVPSISLIVSLK